MSKKKSPKSSPKSTTNGLGNELWLEKYRPKTLETYLDYDKYKDKINKWITPIRDTKATPKPFLVLHGEPGTGKTTLAHCIMAKYGYDVIECNASDTRTKKQLGELINTAKRSVVFEEDENTGKEIGLIMDELDGISSGEANGVGALMDFVFLDDIDKSDRNYKTRDYRIRYPVIATSNSIKEKRLEPILQFGVVINITPPSPESLLGLAMHICKQEGLHLDKTQLRQIISSSNQDYRTIINTLYLIFVNTRNKSGTVGVDTCASDQFADSLTRLDVEVVKICRANKLVGQLNNISELPIHEMISGVVTQVPYHKTMALDPMTDQEYLREYKTEYQQKLLHLIDSDPLYYYLDILDNIPRIALPICHTIITKKLAADSRQTAKPLLAVVMQLLSQLNNNFLVCEDFRKFLDKNNDWRLQTYMNYIACYASTCILNDLNHTKRRQQCIVPRLDTEYHKTYNNYKIASGRYNNYFLFGNNNYRDEPCQQAKKTGRAAKATKTTVIEQPAHAKLNTKLHIIGSDLETCTMMNTNKISQGILKKSSGKLGGWQQTKTDKHPATDIYVPDSKLYGSVVRGLLG
jgi:DNA polymerase III delta prime subunit